MQSSELDFVSLSSEIRFRRNDKIGYGSFAKVYKGENILEKRVVAIKKIKLKILRGQPKLRERVESEIRTMSSLRTHPNILRLESTMRMGNRIYLVLEYCEGGNFGEYLKRHEKLTENLAQWYLKQLAAGLQVLYEHEIIHRDLKPENLLLSDHSERSTLKIADFGFARDLPSEDLAQSICGTPLYMAPEILSSQKYNGKVDLWSVGVILFEMLTGEKPFHGAKNLETQRELIRTTVLSKKLEKFQISPSVTELLLGLLEKHERFRISWKEFLSHRWILGGAQNLSSSFEKRSADDSQRVLSLSCTSNEEHTPPSELHTELEIADEMILKKPTVQDLDFFIIESFLPTDDFYTDCRSFVSEYHRKEKRIDVIIGIVELEYETSTVQALALHLKLLDLLSQLFKFLREAMSNERLQGDTLGFRRISELVPRLQSKFTRIHEGFLGILQKNPSLQQKSIPSSTASKLLFENALKMGLEAAVDEAYELYTKSKNLYTYAIYLLEQTYIDAFLVDSQQDCLRLKGYLQRFNSRKTCVEKKIANSDIDC